MDKFFSGKPIYDGNLPNWVEKSSGEKAQPEKIAPGHRDQIIIIYARFLSEGPILFFRLIFRMQFLILKTVPGM